MFTIYGEGYLPAASRSLSTSFCFAVSLNFPTSATKSRNVRSKFAICVSMVVCWSWIVANSGEKLDWSDDNRGTCVCEPHVDRNEGKACPGLAVGLCTVKKEVVDRFGCAGALVGGIGAGGQVLPACLDRAFEAGFRSVI